MSFDEVLEEFRPVFRAELPEVIRRIQRGLEPGRADYTVADLHTSFREAHNLGSTAGFMNAPELAAAAKSLARVARSLLRSDGIETTAGAMATDTPWTLADAWSAYEQLRAAAAAFLASSTPDSLVEAEPPTEPGE